MHDELTANGHTPPLAPADPLDEDGADLCVLAVNQAQLRQGIINTLLLGEQGQVWGQERVRGRVRGRGGKGGGRKDQ